MRAPQARRSPHVIAVDVGNEALLYDPVRDALHLLDPVGATLWRELDGSTSVARLSERFAEKTRADVQVVARDVRGLVEELRAAGVLAGPDRPSPAPSSPPGDDADSWAASGPAPSLRAPETTRSFEALRHRFAVESNVPGLCGWLDRVLADLAVDGAPSSRYSALDLGPAAGADRFVLALDGQRVARAGWLPRLLDLLLWHVNSEAAARSSDSLVLLHAAAASLDGAAVVLPAASTHGKSTTVAGLVRAGWEYLTDEIVALEPSTVNVVAYPRPICLDRGSWQVLPDLRPSHLELMTGQWQVVASSVRPGAVRARALPAAVVSPRYVAGAPTHLERLTPGEVTLVLADSALAFRDHPERNLQVLARLAAAVPGFRLTVGDLGQAVDLIEAALNVG